MKASNPHVFRAVRAASTAFALTTTVVGAASATAGTETWSEFRGTASRGYVADGQLPSSWVESDYAWRRETGARSVGSPVVARGKVYYLAFDPERSRIALQGVNLEDGELEWSADFPVGKPRLHRRNTQASSTPAADANNVFACWSDAEHTFLKCFDHDGEEVWSRDFGRWIGQHGFGASPRIVGDVVLLLNSQQAQQLDPGEVPGTSRVIAVDRRTGERRWETRLTATRPCYGVPAVYRPAGNATTQIIGANTGDGLFGLDARTGEMLWNKKVFGMRCCSSPLVVDDIAIGTSGSGGGGNHLVAVRIPEAGETAEQLYRIETGAPYVPTPVIKDGLMFLIGDGGIASCVDPATGKAEWVKRIGGSFGASPVIIGDKLLLISLNGEATVLRASSQFEQLGQFDLGGPVGATPAYSDGRLLLRVDDEMRCLDTRTF